MTTFRQPVQMPEKSVFIREMLEAVFPDHTGVSNNRYFVLCEEARKAVGLEQEEELAIESDTFRLMFEINEYSESVWNITGAPMEKSALYKKFSRNELERFCDANNGVLDTWLTKKGKITVQYATAVFFTVLLVSRTACVRSREDFLQKCLSYVGITDMAAPVRNRLRQFDWQERQKETSTFFAQPFHRLTNPAIIMTGLVLLTILRLIGIDTATETGRAKFTKDITALHEKFRTFFDEEERIAAALQAAEQRLWQSMRYFEPRTIGTPQNKLKPQDFFVVPSFRNEKSQEAEEPANPAAEVCHAEKSRRCMIVGNTGQGKSMYLQMFTFCMLYHKYCSEENERVTHICEALQTVEDKYIISIPARMFSACYLQEAYRNWTEDLAALYFNCMWKLTDRDFFSQTSQMSRLKQEQPVSADFAVNDRLKSYLKALAGQGKLILVLDSYDEIVSGNMRRAYTAAVRRFCEEYCVCWQSGEVGAHVLLSGRRMSPDTMTVLYEALSISPEIDQFMIQELSMENIRDLVQNWNSFYHRDMVSRHTERFLREVAVNHFCLDYASNPYMLSVMCMNMEKGFDEITKLYTQTLSGLMRSKTRREDLDVQGVLDYMDRILEDIADETAILHQPHFSRHKLDSYLRKYLMSASLSEDKIIGYIERLHEIFTTVIGLIIPADGSDEDYQFINEQIRFEYAAKGFQRKMTVQKSSEESAALSLPETMYVQEYVGYMVPLICCTDDYRLAEQLVYDLVMHDYTTKEEERCLLRAMLDLLLSRYSSSIATVGSPGTRVEGYIRRAQRLLLMRVMTAERFLMTASEKEAFYQCNAYRSNKDWFTDPAGIIFPAISVPTL